jgi:hypothetical protein
MTTRERLRVLSDDTSAADGAADSGAVPPPVRPVVRARKPGVAGQRRLVVDKSRQAPGPTRLRAVEIAKMAAKGIDIVPHRKRMNDEKLDELFKDPKEELGIVFVCAMWLTGFDAPSCSTIYLDKPMRNHSLMQTIARANRVFPGKQSGLIVDYDIVFASLE